MNLVNWQRSRNCISTNFSCVVNLIICPSNNYNFHTRRQECCVTVGNFENVIYLSTSTHPRLITGSRFLDFSGGCDDEWSRYGFLCSRFFLEISEKNQIGTKTQTPVSRLSEIKSPQSFQEQTVRSRLVNYGRRTWYTILSRVWRTSLAYGTLYSLQTVTNSHLSSSVHQDLVTGKRILQGCRPRRPVLSLQD